MTAYQLLIADLVRCGGQTTYARLLRRHKQYDRQNFAQAVRKARKLGLVEGSGGKGKPIVLAAGAVCPCCGRTLTK